MPSICTRCGAHAEPTSSLPLAEGPLCLVCAERDAETTALRLWNERQQRATRRGAVASTVGTLAAIALPWPWLWIAAPIAAASMAWGAAAAMQHRRGDGPLVMALGLCAAAVLAARLLS